MTLSTSCTRESRSAPSFIIERHPHMSLEVVSRSRCFDGTQFVYRHASKATRTPMRFAAYLPPQASTRSCPVVWFLSGLTCTEENFTTKAGAQRVASELGMILIAPDT